MPIYNLMEDAATAEICRAQVWQWLRHEARTDDGRHIRPEMVHEMLDQQAEKLRGQAPERELQLALRLYREMLDSAEFPEFLTLRAYDHLD